MVYGWNKSYEEICIDKGIKALEERLVEAIDRFVMKTSKSDRFKEDWFPLRQDLGGPEIRNKRVFYDFTFLKFLLRSVAEKSGLTRSRF